MTTETIPTIRCKASAKLDTAPDWAFDTPMSFMYMPGGIHEIKANLGDNKAVDLWVIVNPETAEVLQNSFDRRCEDSHGELWADEAHNGHGKATIRFRQGETKFRYGTLRGNTGIICEGGRPTRHGASLANFKEYVSFSPEFTCDADFHLAREDNGILLFPPRARGGQLNPAIITGLSDDIGGMVNSPAFRQMPRLQAARAWTWQDTVVQRFLDQRENQQAFLNRLAEREMEARTSKFMSMLNETIRRKEQAKIKFN